MAWILLLAAGALEIAWAYSLKLSDGFTRPIPAAVTLAAMTASFALLALAMRTLPLGTAYAIWTGIGALGAFAIGIILLGEAASPQRLLAATFILGGIWLLKDAHA